MNTIQTINEKTAWRNNSPIMKPSDMIKKVTTGPIDEGWKENLRESNQYWYTGAVKPYNFTFPFTAEQKRQVPELLAFRDHVLTFGGEEVCMPFFESEVKELKERGQIWYDDNLELIEGEPSNCHGNSARLWCEAKLNGDNNIHLATGYALTPDGMWRSHSWCVDTTNTETRIIETTVERVLYYGFVMTMAESDQFVKNNFY